MSPVLRGSHKSQSFRCVAIKALPGDQWPERILKRILLRVAEGWTLRGSPPFLGPKKVGLLHGLKFRVRPCCRCWPCTRTLGARIRGSTQSVATVKRFVEDDAKPPEATCGTVGWDGWFGHGGNPRGEQAHGFTHLYLVLYHLVSIHLFLF